jgi:hypothetical protein
MTRVKQTARVSTTPPTPRTDGQMSMVERYPLDVPTEGTVDEEVVHLVHCIQGVRRKGRRVRPCHRRLTRLPVRTSK